MRLRVLHCPTNVGAHPQGLAVAERELGIDSVVVDFDETFFEYDVDRVLFPKQAGIVAREARRWRFLVEALRGYDVVHFNFGTSIFQRAFVGAPSSTASKRSLGAFYLRLLEHRDLPILRAARKAIFVTYQGSDARQMDDSRRRYDVTYAHDVPPDDLRSFIDDDKRRGIRAFDRYADRIFALNPDLLHVLPPRAEFVAYASVDPREWQVALPESDSPSLKIVHAPTDRIVKGTQYLIDAVERLRHAGLPIELSLVEGLSHTDARLVYERADLVVDQLLAGWYGGVAVEAMAMGKPVVAYLRHEDFEPLPAAMRADLLSSKRRRIRSKRYFARTACSLADRDASSECRVGSSSNVGTIHSRSRAR